MKCNMCKSDGEYIKTLKTYLCKECLERLLHELDGLSVGWGNK